MIFKVKCGDTIYELDKLTLGDTRILKNHFGADDLENLPLKDPDIMAGLLAIAIMRADPNKSLLQATAEADSFDIQTIGGVPDEPTEADAGPLADDAAEAVAPQPAETGAPETIPPTAGAPSSQPS